MSNGEKSNFDGKKRKGSRSRREEVTSLLRGSIAGPRVYMIISKFHFLVLSLLSPA